MTLKNLGSHIAGLTAWPGVIMKTSSLDLAAVNKAP